MAEANKSYLGWMGVVTSIVAAVLTISCASRDFGDNAEDAAVKVEGAEARKLGDRLFKKALRSTVLITSSAQSGFLCTGVVVSPVHVLTSARCMFVSERAGMPVGRQFQPNELAVLFAADYASVLQKVSSEATAVFVDRVTLAPQYSADQVLRLFFSGDERGSWWWADFLKSQRPSMHDLALLELRKPVPAPFAPAELPKSELRNSRAATFVISGYVPWVNPKSLAPKARPGRLGVLRVIPKTADAKGKVRPRRVSHFPRSQLLAFNFVENRTPCDWDAGGPLFLQVTSQNGVRVGELLGVMSRSPFNRSGRCLGQAVAYTTLYKHMDWLMCTSGLSLKGSPQNFSDPLWRLNQPMARFCEGQGHAVGSTAASKLLLPRDRVVDPAAGEAEQDDEEEEWGKVWGGLVAIDWKQMAFFSRKLVEEGTQAEIRSYYRRKAREVHPDVNPDLGDARFVQLSSEYEKVVAYRKWLGKWVEAEPD